MLYTCILNQFVICINFQIVVRAHDLGIPQLESQDSATVTVRVQRNRNCPQLQGEPYSSNIEQTKAVNSEVLNIAASDFDPAVSSIINVKRTLCVKHCV